MKKLLLIPALLAGSLALAEQKKFEISPMIGYDFADNGIKVKNRSYPVVALEFQANITDSRWSPEFSLLYSPNVDYAIVSPLTNQDTDVLRITMNGVYTFDKYSIKNYLTLIPFTKIGLGYESINNPSPTLDDGIFLDAGIGAKLPLSENLSLKMEAIYMAKDSSDSDSYIDSNLITIIGLTFTFGGNTKKTSSIVNAKEETIAVAIVSDLDDDNDGVPNSKDNCNYTLPGLAVDVLGCALIIDNDKDGVNNNNDKCPNTLSDTKVDANGCKIIQDSDKDGILDDKDFCKNTPLGEVVNSDGCPKELHLQINFENDSVVIKESSEKDIDAFAQFLKEYTNYHAKIVGYTDSVGNAEYNKKLSLNRANQLRALLIDKGVNPSQLTVSGMGEANPIADNSTSEGREKNRRIEAELTRD